MQDVINDVVGMIKDINKKRADAGDCFISQDQSNEELLNVFSKVNNKYDLDLIDNSDYLNATLGREGLDRIRDAEQGL